MSKLFATEALRLAAIQMLQGTADPTAGGGVAAEVGSKYFRSGTAGDYTKTAAGNTAWTLVSADIYFNVANYGATGDGVTDDRAAIQATIDDAAVLGGTIFFPYGAYLCVLNGTDPAVFDLDTLSNLRFAGSGEASTLIISGNCGGIARQLFSLTSCSSIEFEELTFSQAGLSNVVAQSCHIIDIGADADVTKILNCSFLGGIATAGSYVNIAGTVGALATNVWISDGCQMTDCGSASITVDGYTARIWIEDSAIDQVGNNIDDTILIFETNGGSIDDVKIFGTEITNDSLYALRVGATNGVLINRIQISSGNLFYGFVSLGWMDQCQMATNEVYASVAGISDAVVTIDSENTQVQLQSNIIARASTCDAGRCLVVVPGATTEVTTRLQAQNNRWIQETTFGVVYVGDAADVQLTGNAMHVDNAGATAHSAYVIEAAVDNVDNVLIADQIGAVAGTWEFGIEYLASGGDIGVNNQVGGQISAVDVGIRWDSSGGGSFSSVQCMYTSNTVVATTSNWTSSAALYPRVGGNACVFGVNIIEGDDAPENNVTARIGSIYLDRTGGSGSTMYIKESGTGNTGWAAK